MESLNAQLQPFVEWLLRTTVQASILICVILLLQRILRNRLSIRWHYGLWLLLLVRMSLPWAPQSRASMFNLIPRPAHHQQAEYKQQENSEQSVGSDFAGSEPVESVPASPATTTQESPEVVTVIPSIKQGVQNPPRPDFSRIIKILPLLWLTGALVLAVYVCAGNFNLWRIVKRRRPLTDQKILELLEDCKAQMGIQTILGIVPTDKVESPALFGFVRPRLLLPHGMIETLSRQELRFVLFHELAHLKRHDIYIGWLMSLLQVLHWFNPLVWLAFYRMRSDRELACDALVLARTQSEEPKSYGRIIVNLVERFSRPQRLPGMAGILETKAQLKRRVTMIAKFKKNSYQWSPLAVILIAILACVSLPDAVRTKASQTSSTEPAPKIALRRIWAGPGVDIEGAPSPDGRYLSYVDWDTGDLAVYEITTGEKQRLTNKGSWDESNEFAQFSKWSPDGKQIVYDWYNQDDFIELRIVGLDGSKPRILYRNEQVTWAQTYDWSPDGKHILAVFQRKNQTTQIVLISVADGSVRVLKTLNKYNPHNMSFSPDGRYIVYDFPQKEDSPESDISLLLTDGIHEIPLIEHPADDRVLGWSPDGKHILFTSDRTGTESVWLIEVADSKPQGYPELVKPDFGQRFIPMGFTKDGSFYYGSGAVGVSDVYIAKLDLETGKVLIPPKKAIRRFEGHNLTPDYSPDGKYLAYTSTRGRRKFLCIRLVETGQEQEFHSKLKRILEPRWSPDGSSILVGGMDYKGNRWGIYRIDIKTGTFTLVLPPPEGIRLTTHEWSRDGKSFFVSRSSRKDKVSQIMLREIKSGTPKEIYRTSDLSRFRLSCSPDGKWLAFINIRNNGALRIISTDGGEHRELYKCEQKNEQLITLRWTADGKYILFVIREIKQKKFNLWRIPIEGGEPQKLGLEMNITSLSVHPDGQHIAFNAVTIAPPEVWVMENFLPDSPVAMPEPESGPTLRRIEVRGRGRVHSRPSFDGKYMSDVEGKTDKLIIRELATGRERKLTGKSDPNAFAYESRISPDSKRVAFLQFDPVEEDFDLCIINFDGSGQRTLMDSRQIAGYFNIDAWSPDGKYIFGRLERKPMELVRVSADDGSLQVIRKFEQGKLSSVQVSPDGRYLAYSRAEQTDSKPDIFIFDLEQNQETSLVTHPAADKLLGWTPDGQTIFFTSDRNGTWDGWLMRVVDGKGRGLPEVIKAGIGDITPIGFTRSGSFYYNFRHEAWNVYTAKLDLDTGEALSAPSPVRHVGKDVRPDWSPDGQYLAYCSQRDRDKPQIIRIRTLATGQERELKTELPHFDWLRWCPDNRHLLITNFNRGSLSVVYKLDVQTGERTVLVQSDEQRIRQAELSADGKTLAYRIRGSGNANWLIVRDMETGREKELLRSESMGAAALLFWALSPDGKHIALSMVALSIKEDGMNRAFVLKIISVASGEARTVVGDSVGELAWINDGRDILFAKGFKELWRVSAEGGEPRKLWEWKQMLWGLRIHPDGQRLAFFSGGNVSEMWVMENFLPAAVTAARK